MAAPNNNQFWKARTKHGRNKLFESPDVLWDACCEYFQWTEDNPIIEDKVNFYQGVAAHEPMPKMRAMTISGMCLFLDISEDTWGNYRKDKDFLGVTNKAEKIIYNQKFQGAAADMLNANIIARDLGLKDKVEQANVVSLESMTDEELDKAIKARQSEIDGD